jgi:Xaa-Pro aminopeptidase
LVVPGLEAARVEPRPDEFTIRPWGETDDPVAIVAALLPDDLIRVAIGDQTWALFLLRLQAAVPKANFESATPITRELRMRKGPEEVAALAAVGAAADRVAATLAGMHWIGRTERELSAEISAGLRREGHDRVNFAIVGSGPNGASPHHSAAERVIEAGDVIVCDFGGTMDGYCSDITRVVSVGPPSAEVEATWSVLRAAQQAAFERVAPGVAAQEVDRAARAVIAAAGFGEYFIHRTGHGIGLEEHEEPYIVEGNDILLEEGMAFSIEPGIYLPGRWGIRLEDIVVVEGSGGRRLNNAPRDLVVADA